MAARWLKIVVPGALVVAGATGAFMSDSERNCQDLVTTTNAVVNAANAASTEAQVTALVPQLASTSATLRTEASDFGDPFRVDAQNAASALDDIATAIRNRNGDAYDAAINHFNSVVDGTNRDCDNAG